MVIENHLVMDIMCVKRTGRRNTMMSEALQLDELLVKMEAELGYFDFFFEPIKLDNPEKN
jgi:hypothetical protein